MPSLRALAPLVASTALTALGSAPAAAQGVDFDVVAAGAAAGQPTAIAFAPGVPDRVYVASVDGVIRVIEDGAPLPTPFLDISGQVRTGGENGLIGMEFDPDFQSNRLVWVAYTNTTGQGDSVLSSFTVPAGQSAVADPMSESILVGPIPQASTAHKAGDIQFGPDGYLYHSLGDGGNGLTSNPNIAQDLGSPKGKILRLDPDLPPPHAPATNPFVGVGGADPRVFALGLRNPFRFDVDAGTGAVVIGDVGENAWEEINVIRRNAPGDNFGWPCTEGPDCWTGTSCTCNGPTLTAPYLALSHSAPDSFCSITGGVVVRGAGIPSLEGRFLCADLCSGTFLSVDVSGPTPDVVDLSDEITDVGAPIRFVTDFAQDPVSGDIWFCQHTTARLWRIQAPNGFARYCDSTENSSGASARIDAMGVRSLGAGDLTFDVTGLPAQQFGFFIASDERVTLPGLGGGPGILCVGPTIYRWNDQVLLSSTAGAVQRQSDLTDLPFGVTPLPGETWHFQYWTRDDVSGPTSNTSDAMSITFEM